MRMIEVSQFDMISTDDDGEWTVTASCQRHLRVLNSWKAITGHLQW